MAENIDETPPNLQGAQKWAQFPIFYRGLKRWVSATFFLFLTILLVGAIIFWFDLGVVIRAPFNAKMPKQKPEEFHLNCTNIDTKQTCTANYTAKPGSPQLSAAACPQYFGWIHEDLRTWKSNGISREMLEGAKHLSHFRIVIINGQAYLDQFHRAFQTRDVFTIWGIVQLLRLYPGKVPDLELMFRCEDRPVIQKRDYQGPNATLVPPIFQYCGNDNAFGIVFPDWSFWGWPEVNIRPWSGLLEAIIEGSKRKKWKKKVPYAFWRGNPYVSPNRGDLMKCNVNFQHDWNARLYSQDWVKEDQQRYKHSHLEDQCTHRYKIYIEGVGWSVSEKYILACNSMTLLVKPDFYDFFSRSLVPLQHYWPISTTNKCKDIKFAVDWGNAHPHKAQEIGRGGSKFIEEDLKMENVYTYMFHLLSEYAKLLKFKPTIPRGAVLLCAESMACSEQAPLTKRFMEESFVRSPIDELPCAMPSPYDPSSLQAIFQRNQNITRQVEQWEKEYWDRKKKH